MASSTHPLQEGSFDPLATLRRLGLDATDPQAIRLRVLWLRQREPSARITTTLVTLDDRVVVISATVALSDGGEGSGHAASQLADSTNLAEAIETTELRALGRALDNLGYIVVEHTASPPASTPDLGSPAPDLPNEPAHAPAREEDRPTAVPPPESSHRQPPEHVRALRSIRERDQRTQQQPPADAPPESDLPRTQQHEPAGPSPAPADRNRPRPIRPAAVPPADDTGEPSLEDVSWTAFWEWARETYQLRSRVQLEELLGQPVGNKLPGELRRLLLAHFNETGHDES